MVIKPFFFWTESVKKIIWIPFWWIILMAIILWVPFLRPWWWVFAPIFLSAEARKLYLWWLEWDYAYAKTKWVILEIVTPKEILTPVKAMEDVFSIMFSIADVANWKDIWVSGELDNTPYWMSWEIASIEGNIHFYARVMKEHRHSLESVVYSHYPEVEIFEVPDYTKLVPQNVPNEDWDTYGEDFILYRPPAYPIKTYEKFFEPQGEKISAEEKRIDPLNSFLESLSRLGPGEHFWFQCITLPIFDQDDPWRSAAKKEINKISRRPEKKQKTFGQELYENLYWLIMGPTKEGSGEKATYKWLTSDKSESGEDELLLTPGEREILLAIEDKIKKPAFRVNIKGVYVAKRDVFSPVHKIMTRSYFSHFQTNNLNAMGFSPVTRPKVKYFMVKRRIYLRARKMFKNAVTRLTPLFPNRDKVLAILNTEELATIFHFPLKITGLVAPTMNRIESKKGGPPPNLPT